MSGSSPFIPPRKVAGNYCRQNKKTEAGGAALRDSGEFGAETSEGGADGKRQRTRVVHDSFDEDAPEIFPGAVSASLSASPTAESVLLPPPAPRSHAHWGGYGFHDSLGFVSAARIAAGPPPIGVRPVLAFAGPTKSFTPLSFEGLPSAAALTTDLQDPDIDPGFSFSAEDVNRDATVDAVLKDMEELSVQGTQAASAPVGGSSTPVLAHHILSASSGLIPTVLAPNDSSVGVVPGV